MKDREGWREGEEEDGEKREEKREENRMEQDRRRREEEGGGESRDDKFPTFHCCHVYIHVLYIITHANSYSI